MVHDTEGELPWDPLWAYVLGDDENTKRGFRRQKKDANHDEGIISYIKDVMPIAESRDDGKFVDRSDNKGSREESKKKGFIWRRNIKPEEAEPGDSWEWHISTGSSYDDLVPIPPMNEKEKRKEPTPGKVQRGHDAALPPPTPHSSPNRTRNTSPAKERRTRVISPRQRREQATESDVWDWQIPTGAKKEKSTFTRIFRKEKEPDNWDFISTASQEKGVRRVRFIRSSNSKDSEAWIDTREVIAQLERSQSSLFDWVGINPSSDEADPQGSKVHTQSASKKNRGTIFTTSKGKKQPRSASTTLSDSGFLFGEFFASLVDDNDSSDEGSSFQSSTDYSSAGTLEEGLSDDDSRSVPTLQSDTSNSQAHDIKDSVHPQANQSEVNEVRLAFQPINQDETNANHLAIIREESSDEESQLSASDRNTTETVKKFEHAAPEAKQDEQENPSSSFTLGQPCAMEDRNSPYDQRTEESSIPFHQVGLIQSTAVSKCTNTSDEQQCVSSSVPINPQVLAKRSTGNNPPLPALSDPQSLAKKKSNSEVNMYPSCDRFGSKTMSVKSAPVPRIARGDGAFSLNNIIVKVEVSLKSTSRKKENIL
jgi:hypothetical protein